MDKFWERYIQSRPAPGSSKGAFDAFAAASRDPGPRNMAQGGRIGFYDGELVREGPKTGEYKVKFPTNTKLAEKYKGTKYGTKKEIRDLIKKRDLVAQKSYRAGVEKSALQKSLTRDVEFKNLVDEIVESGDLTALKSNIRQRGGKIPAQTIVDLWNPAIKGGKGSDAMKKLSKILGRDADDILSLHEGRVAKIYETKRAVDIEKALAAVNPNKKKFLKLLESSDNLSLKNVAKQLKLSQLATNDLINSVYKDIYKNSTLLGKGETNFVRYLPNKKTPLKTLLSSMSKIEGVDKIERRTINDLLDKTIGFKAANKYKNPELYKLFKNRINEYYKLKDALPEGLILNLDHPLSMKIIGQLGTDARLQKINVSPITQELNLGLKAQFDKAYGNALKNKNVTAQRAIEKIANQIELPMTKVGKQVTNPMKFKFIDQDIKSQILSSLENQNKIAKNLKNIDPNLLKAAGMEKYKFNVPEVSKGIIKHIQNLGCPGKAAGGRINFDIGGSTACITRGLEKLKNPTNLSAGDQANIRALKEMGKGAKGARTLGQMGRVLAKVGIGGELVFGGLFAVTDYAGGANKQEILSNFTYGLAGKSMDEQLKEKDPLYGRPEEIIGGFTSLQDMLKREETQPIGKMSLKPGAIDRQTTVLEEKMQPFMRGPRNEEFEYDLFAQQQAKDAQTLLDFEKEKAERKLKREALSEFDEEAFAYRGYYMGGGIVGIRKPHAIPPERQGLRSIMINGKKS